MVVIPVITILCDDGNHNNQGCKVVFYNDQNIPEHKQCCVEEAVQALWDHKEVCGTCG